jgi:hypothetical protein
MSKKKEMIKKLNEQQGKELIKKLGLEEYNAGCRVKNPFSGVDVYLNKIELSLYDFLIGCSFMEIEDSRVSKVKEFFRITNSKAYMALLD